MGLKKKVRRRTNFIRTVVIVSGALLLVVCTTFTIFVPRPRSDDDTLLISAIKRSGSSDVALAFYKLHLTRGEATETIKVSAGSKLSYIRGLPPGSYVLDRIEAAKQLQLPEGEIEIRRPASLEYTVDNSAIEDLRISIDIDIGQITILPFQLHIRTARTWHQNTIETTQTCTIVPLSSTELRVITDRFYKSWGANKWRARAFADQNAISENAIYPDIEVRLFSANPQEETPVCFLKGTVIHISDGVLPIEEIRRNEIVKSCNVSTGEWENMIVIDTKLHEYTGSILVIRTDESRVTVTAEHPFWRIVDGIAGEWTRACDLAVGDTLMVAAGDAKTTRVTRISERWVVDAVVYNL